METVNQLIDRSVLSIGSTPGMKPEVEPGKRLYKVNGQTLTIPELLWSRLTEIYGHKFTSAFGDSPSAGWELALMGLEPDKIKRGLAKMAASGRYTAWPPAALDFRSLCLPSDKDLGLPEKGQAFWQATNWSRIPRAERHPAVLYALRLIHDPYAFRSASSRDAEKIWAEAWLKTVEHVFYGGELPAIPEEVEHKPVRADSKTAHAGIEHIKAMFENR